MSAPRTRRTGRGPARAAIGPAPAIRVTGRAAAGVAAEPIDAVYLWVNGNDPEYQATVREYLARERQPLLPETFSANRFREHGELRYSLRSLDRFAPWIRRVYLVTNGQVPEWLDTTNPRVAVIPHAAIFPDPRDLPTFNSHAIGLHLHRIPGLSRRFLCFNDDVFLGRDVALEDFVAPSGRQRVYVDVWPLPSDPDAGPVHHRAYAYTQRLLDRRFGPRRARRAISHAPQLYDRRIIEEIGRIWPEEMRETSSHRFRSPTDVVGPIVYAYYLIEAPVRRGRREPPIRPRAVTDSVFVQLTDNAERAWQHLRQIAVYRPKFFCVNDDLSDQPTDRTVAMQYRAFLAWYFPRPSSFERLPS